MRSDWKIGWNEYKELYYFCLQYKQKKRDADALLTLRISTPEPAATASGEGVFIAHGGSRITDPVAAAADKRERLLADCHIIEQAAIIAGRDLAPYLLRCVTEKNGVKRILCEAPISQATLYRMRREFFYILKGLKDGQ